MFTFEKPFTTRGNVRSLRKRPSESEEVPLIWNAVADSPIITILRDLIMKSITAPLRWTSLFVVLLAGTDSLATQPVKLSAHVAAKTYVYIGTYANRDEDGIHIYQLDPKTGALTRIAGVQGIKNPSFQAIHPNRRFLYSVSESQDFEGKRSGSVSAFAIDEETGGLTFMNAEPTMGSGPCHLIVDHSGENVLVANYGSGSLSVHPVQSNGRVDVAHNLIQHTGSSVHPRQKSPHAHCINNDANDRFVVSADLGLDKVLIYRFNRKNSSLTPNSHMAAVSVKPGAGPRHFAFHPNNRFGYVINELNSTVTAFSFDPDLGRLSTIQDISTLPEEFGGENTTAEVFVSPDGRFLYGSNRGHHSIVVFSIDPESGELARVSHHSTQGEQPRNFGIDPTGSFLLAANQRSGNVVVFRIDRTTGKLSPTGDSLQLKKPVCVTFLQK